MEAIKKIQKNRKKRKIKNKKREGGSLLFLLRDPHSYFILYLVLHRDHHTCIKLCGGPLHYRTWLVYSNYELPQMSSSSSWVSKLDAPPLVPLESLPLLICASFAWQSLLPTSYLSFGFLSPMIVLIDVSLSHIFVFLPHHYSFSPFKCQLSCLRSSIAWVLKISKGSESVWLVPG